MRSRRNIIALVLAICLFVGAGLVASADVSGRVAPFRAGDRVALIGDSITAWGYYGALVNMFYATRFPDRKIYMYYNGIGGDQARYTQHRAEPTGGVFERDILRNRPTVATIMLGMNDSGYGNVWNQSADETEAAAGKAADVYRQSMDNLIKKLRDNGVQRIILILSSPYDETGEAKSNPLTGKNDFIRNVLGDYLRAKCRELGEPLVDFNTPMLEINRREQPENPQFSIVDMGDRIHPLNMGHFVMAYVFLKSMGLDEMVSEVVIDAGKAEVLSARNCEVSDLTCGDNRISFECLARALPFPSGKLEYDKHVPFDEEFNREIVRILSLAGGTYALGVDGVEVGRYTAAELAKGINLAGNHLTPQYKQAEAVYGLSMKQWQTGNSRRDLIRTENLFCRIGKKTKQEKLAYMKGKKPSSVPVYRERDARYVKLLEEDRLDEVIAEVIEESEAITDRVYELNKPALHTYVLEAIPPE